MNASQELSIVAGATRADVVLDPFPHLVRQPALDSALYAELAASFPPASLFTGGAAEENNRYYPLCAAKSLADPRVPRVWKELIAYHVSAELFAEACALFGLEGRGCSDFALRVRGTPPEPRAATPEIALDCQFYYCSPAFLPNTTSRTPHVDRPVALFGGLLYFRLPADDSTGGDLELYRFRGAEREYGENRAVPPRLIERVKTIPYAANTLVLFPNSAEAVHGVSPRSVTPYPRLHINFVAEMQ